MEYYHYPRSDSCDSFDDVCENNPTFFYEDSDDEYEVEAIVNAISNIIDNYVNRSCVNVDVFIAAETLLKLSNTVMFNYRYGVTSSVLSRQFKIHSCDHEKFLEDLKQELM